MNYCLFSVNNRILFYDLYRKNIPTSTVFIPLGKLSKGLRFFVGKYCPMFNYLFYTKSFKNCGNVYASIILFDSSLTIDAANYIKNKYPNLRVIYWFWNHVKSVTQFERLLPTIEKWSYDPEDCKKYGFRFNTQFYFPELFDEKASEITHDFYFVGSEKGRGRLIEECKSIFEQYNFTYLFKVKYDNKHEKKSWVRYEDVIEDVKHSKCVVDLLPSVQKGLSIRPLEALFLQKKLLTNFKAIRNIEFYNRNNIFILGEDDTSKLSEFLRNDYKPIDDDIMDFYSFKSWIKRFN